MPALVRALFWLRGLMLLASIGAVFSALLMFWTGFGHLAEALGALIDVSAAGHGHARIASQVLQSLDAFLFGIVCMIFAYGIALGFVFRLPKELSSELPAWMKADSIAELKHTLVEVVIVGLIVIFARVAVEESRDLGWDDLVLPIAVVLLAGSVKLMRLGQNGHGPARGAEQPGDHKAEP